jgi:hypothetical protein
MPSSARPRSKSGASAVRTARPLARKEIRDAVDTWGLPAVAGSLFLLLYILGNVDVIETTPALAADALLLIGIVLFFPMRYARRLGNRGRAAAALLAVLWLGVVYYPIYKRIYPGERIASLDVSPAAVPVDLPTAGRGTAVDLVIDGHLHDADRGRSRVARYSLTVEAPGVAPQAFTGEFKESWLRQAQGRRESVDLHRERSATTVQVENPGNGDLRVTALSVVGHAEERLTLTLYEHALLPLWATMGMCAALLVAAVAYDRATGAGETAASLAIATGAALTGAYAFPSVSSPHPSFRELVGAAIVGALLGGPLGGLASWLLSGRLPIAAYRPRSGGR